MKQYITNLRFFTLITVILHIFIAHARNGHISTSGLKSDVTKVFLDPGGNFCDWRSLHLRQI